MDSVVCVIRLSQATNLKSPEQQIVFTHRRALEFVGAPVASLASGL